MHSSRTLGSLKPRSIIAQVITVLLLMVSVVLISKFWLFYNGPVISITEYAPEQPIPYSHKLHAGDLQIPCEYCHTYARRSEMAGIPSTKKCQNCHDNLAVESEAITALKKHIEAKTPIEWERIYDLPDHVWFSHKRHIAKDIACQKCHGAVETLVINANKVEHQMGFCLDCHQEKEAPTDCWTCHT